MGPKKKTDESLIAWNKKTARRRCKILWKRKKGCAYPAHIRGGIGDMADSRSSSKCHTGFSPQKQAYLMICLSCFYKDSYSAIIRAQTSQRGPFSASKRVIIELSTLCVWLTNWLAHFNTSLNWKISNPLNWAMTVFAFSIIWASVRDILFVIFNKFYYLVFRV